VIAASATPLQIDAAAKALMRGELVAFPTETVYGLGADAASAQAVERIYAAKGRPSNHPVIVHVAQPQDIEWWCCDIAPQAWQLAQAFWPGPLTMILKRAVDVDAAVSGGQNTIGVRCPSHPVAQALLTRFAQLKTQAGQQLAGVAAPSANRFGRVSPTRAEHVRVEFAQPVALGIPVLEGGDSEVGIESTIVDLSSVQDGGQVAVLRPGAITAQQLADVLGCPVVGQTEQSPRVSGSLKAHYAPTTPLTLCDQTDLSKVIERWLATNAGRLAVMTRQSNPVTHARIDYLLMPDDPTAYARLLYATLRQVDTLGVTTLLCEAVPKEDAWAAVSDRLNRAAAAFERDSSLEA
jgi:L-threonylcarbamoyladenylate synthase